MSAINGRHIRAIRLSFEPVTLSLYSPAAILERVADRDSNLPKTHPSRVIQIHPFLLDRYTLHLAKQLPSIYIYIHLFVHPLSRGTPGATARVKMAPLTVSGCRLRTYGAKIVSDLDKSIAQFYQGRLTTASRLAEFV